VFGGIARSYLDPYVGVFGCVVLNAGCKGSIPIVCRYGCNIGQHSAIHIQHWSTGLAVPGRLSGCRRLGQLDVEGGSQMGVFGVDAFGLAEGSLRFGENGGGGF
jgi:hypothetical protein